MSELLTPNTPPTPAPPAVPAEPAGTQAGSSPQEQDEAVLPEWAQRELSAVRDEAAKRRIELKELKSQLDGMTSLEEAKAAIAQAEGRAAELERDAVRQRLARTYGLPDALVERIRGEDADAMEDDAKALAELVANTPRTPRPDRLQGGAPPAPLSAAEQFAQLLNGRA